MEDSVTEVNIKLDSKSVQIIKKVNAIHRDSIINLGLSLIEKTQFYKTLTGEETSILDKVVSLDSLTEQKELVKVPDKKEEPKQKKATTTWDAF